MGVRRVRTSRSHKHESGSKAESIWMRFSKGQNRKDFAGGVCTTVFSGRDRLWLVLSYFKTFFLSSIGRRWNKDGKRVFIQASAPFYELLPC